MCTVVAACLPTLSLLGRLSAHSLIGLASDVCSLRWETAAAAVRGLTGSLPGTCRRQHLITVLVMTAGREWKGDMGQLFSGSGCFLFPCSLIPSTWKGEPLFLSIIWSHRPHSHLQRTDCTGFDPGLCGPRTPLQLFLEDNVSVLPSCVSCSICIQGFGFSLVPGELTLSRASSQPSFSGCLFCFT